MKISLNQQALGETGLTLIELMIGTAISLIIMGAALTAFLSSQSASKTIDQKSAMAVNARGAMYRIEENIRLMGFNPEQDTSPGLAIDTAGPGLLRFWRNDLDDPFDNAKDKIVYMGLNAGDDPDRDGFPKNGVSGLVIDGQRAADHIAALRFAYAFDADGNGAVDVSGNGNVQWAIDADNDGLLDRLLDTNDDGFINSDDAPGGVAMPVPVDIDSIRAVRVWLLVRSRHPVDNPAKQQTFFVCGQPYTPASRHAHTLLTSSVRCRNLF